MNAPQAVAAAGWHCSACGIRIQKDAATCPGCGARLTRPLEWHEHPLWIAVIALTLLGPFALPLVWRSRAMERGAKWAFSLGLAFYTIIVVWASIWISRQMFERLVELQNSMSGLGM